MNGSDCQAAQTELDFNVLKLTFWFGGGVFLENHAAFVEDASRAEVCLISCS
jgi:hypothetical protein